VLGRGGTWGRPHLISLKTWTVKRNILTLFEMFIWNFRNKSITRKSVYSYTIWNDLELQTKFINTRMLNGALWRYLKRFGIAEKKLKTRTLNVAFWRYLKLFRTADTILKTRTLNGAFLRHLIRYGTSKYILKTRTLNSAFWRHSKLYGIAVKKRKR